MKHNKLKTIKKIIRRRTKKNENSQSQHLNHTILWSSVCVFAISSISHSHSIICFITPCHHSRSVVGVFTVNTANISTTKQCNDNNNNNNERDKKFTCKINEYRRGNHLERHDIRSFLLSFSRMLCSHNGK